MNRFSIVAACAIASFSTGLPAQAPKEKAVVVYDVRKAPKGLFKWQEQDFAVERAIFVDLLPKSKSNVMDSIQGSFSGPGTKCTLIAYSPSAPKAATMLGLATGEGKPSSFGIAADYQPFLKFLGKADLGGDGIEVVVVADMYPPGSSSQWDGQISIISFRGGKPLTLKKHLTNISAFGGEVTEGPVISYVNKTFEVKIFVMSKGKWVPKG